MENEEGGRQGFMLWYLVDMLQVEQFLRKCLLIRTSGEQRLSNFLLFEIAYCELYFSKVRAPFFFAGPGHCLLSSQNFNGSFSPIPPAALAPHPPATATLGVSSHPCLRSCTRLRSRNGIWPSLCPLLSLSRLHTWPPHSQFHISKEVPMVLPDVVDTSMKDMLTQCACLHSPVVVFPYYVPQAEPMEHNPTQPSSQLNWLSHDHGLRGRQGESGGGLTTYPEVFPGRDPPSPNGSLNPRTYAMDTFLTRINAIGDP
eukprot:1144818-Pelagomonas_calceolata.AAC.1